jgi:hypothetical protein
MDNPNLLGGHVQILIVFSIVVYRMTEQPVLGSNEPSIVTVENPTVDRPVGKSGTVSVWVNLDKLKLFKAAVRLQGTSSLSDELNQFFDKRTAEIKGIMPNSDLTGAEAQAARLKNYEVAKKRVFEMHLDIIKMVKFFKEQHCWTDFLEAFRKYIDYDKSFDSPKSSYGHEMAEKVYDGYSIRFIEEASDREADFKRETSRFLLRNRDVEFVYDWVGFVERLRESRKLGRQMLQFQMDSLGPEQLSKLQEEERLREENRLKEEAEVRAEARVEEERKKQEALKRRQEAQERLQESGQNQATIIADDDVEEDESEEFEEEEDYSEEGELESPTVTVLTEGDKESPEECRVIVPVGEKKC